MAAVGVERDELGTPYGAKYRIDYAPRHVLRQVVYPYALGGAVTFTPRGQHIGQDYESFQGGWHAAGPRLLRVLIAHGFPRHDPADPEKAASAATAEHDGLMAPNINSPIRRWGWSLVAGVVLLILLVLSAGVVSRPGALGAASPTVIVAWFAGKAMEVFHPPKSLTALQCSLFRTSCPCVCAGVERCAELRRF